jgi:UDP-N-acetylmuramoyl-L-alanyl-D-glutamate--2,6-diaminopimelate ligase
MKLKQLLSGVHVRGNYHRELEITGVAYDSRRVKPGYIFVAIKGFKVDGHDFIDQAREAGAVALIVENERFNKTDCLKVESSRKALSIISGNFYNHPSREMKVIGVTGTNGKTSITYIVRDLLIAMKQKYGLIGTISNQIGDKIYPTSVTTPESLELCELFNEMVECSTDTAIMEVSSHSLSLERVTSVDFDVAVFTNLTQDHLDYHKNMNHYFKAKKKLFDLAKKSVINLDDPYGQKLYNEREGVLTYAIDHEADLKATQIEMTDSGTRLTFQYQKRTYHVETPFHGDIYVHNILASYGALIQCGYKIEEIIDLSKDIKPVRGRFERVPNDQGISVFVDYAHTPDALKNVLLIARSFTSNRVISVFGCGGDRDKTKRPLMGRISEKVADYSIVTSDNPRTENPERIIDDILKGLPNESNKYSIQPDREAAIRQAIKMAKKGDTVIIAGKGHETYQIIGTEVTHFNDYEKAIEALKERRQ